MRVLATFPQGNQEPLVKARMEDPSWAWGEQIRGMWYLLPSMLWHCWLGDRKGVCLACWYVSGVTLLLSPVLQWNPEWWHSATSIPGFSWKMSVRVLLYFYTRDALHRAFFAVVRCPSVCLSVTLLCSNG